MIRYRSRSPLPMLVVGLADTGFFGLVSPVASNVFVIIVGCLLVVITCYVVSLTGAAWLAHWFSLPQQGMRRAAVGAASLASFLILMQSVGQLSVRDVLAALPLVVVLYVYFGFLRPGSRA